MDGREPKTMQGGLHVWAIVLAAGDGVRLGALARDAGGSCAPKQFCSFDGRSSMVRWAICRAARVVPSRRIVTVVAEKHRRWWQPELSALRPENVVVQPSNRGTAAGLLLPLLSILRRDHRAVILVLPSDHYVDDEASLGVAIDEAVRRVRNGSPRLFLLGIEPTEAAAEYGWIVPVGPRSLVQEVATFVEKPSPRAASRLERQGALLNSFMLIGPGLTLLDLFARYAPGLYGGFSAWKEVAPQPSELSDLYRRMTSHDFSTEVLQRCCTWLSVVRVPECGWMDIGTPERLGVFQEQLRRRRCASAPRTRAIPASPEAGETQADARSKRIAGRPISCYNSFG